MTDRELLRQYAEHGSQDAFRELVRLRIGFVLAAARRQTGGNAALAEEVTQSVFIDLARKAGGLGRHEALLGWLFTSTRFTATKAMRSERRRLAREHRAYLMNLSDQAAAPEVSPEAFRPLLDEALQQLSPGDRSALFLRFFGGCSLAEVGRALGTSEPAAQKKVERALGRLRNFMHRRGLVSTAAAFGAALAQEAAAAPAPPNLAAAVAGGALAAGPASGISGLIILLMSAKKTAAFVAAAAAIGLLSVGTTVHELAKARETQAQIATAAAQLRRDEARREDLTKRVQTYENAIASLNRQMDALTRSKETAAAKSAREHADWERFSAAYPEARRMIGDMYKLLFERSYWRQVARGEISAAQLDAVADRYAERALATAQLAPGGIDDNDVLSAAELRAAIGDRAYQESQSQRRSAVAANIVEEASGSAGLAGDPLSDDQKEKLVQIAVDNGSAAGSALTLASVNWQQAASQARAVLSPAQWQAAEWAFLDAQYQASLAKAQANAP
ncbi:MAG TPA: sigma-70 family RNA polymerase sigma factor [Opitutaceae bacterium]|jgi:RNA polymerase sigma factor (sigma-70 family)|nr:sigma-70 family RNA polymerase sigma factor [Opitutaceae bacterium]